MVVGLSSGSKDPRIHSVHSTWSQQQQEDERIDHTTFFPRKKLVLIYFVSFFKKDEWRCSLKNIVFLKYYL